MEQHFLLVTYPAQGHINPALHLAKRLAETATARITFCTTVAAQRKMFPEIAAKPGEEIQDGPITYIPLPDGYDDDGDNNGSKSGTHDLNLYFSRFKTTGSKTLSSVIETLRHRGRRVSCIIYTLLPWVADVARHHGIPSALYWIQPATVLAIYYHYFHGYSSLAPSAQGIVNLPGLPPLRTRDLPSFLTVESTDDPYAGILDTLGETLHSLDREAERSNSKTKVLVNTFDELEADALSAVDKLDMIPVGPVLPCSSSRGDLIKQDGEGYMEWLDSKEGNSVIYVSFGSVAVLGKEQMEEILKGVRGSGRPYLWVVRRECGLEGVELGDGENGVVVEWCSQVRVLSHPSVGCFVTHCGWNSTVEGLVCGVPTIGVPQWTDQATCAMLAERVWGTGVRGEVNGDGVLEGEELKRCLDLVLGEGERSLEMRRKVGFWKERAMAAVSFGGSSDRNLRAFMDQIDNCVE